MSIIATIIGIAILCLKTITNKALLPKCSYVIWMVFIIALVFPVSIPSKISIYNYIDIAAVKTIENNETDKTLNLMNNVIDDGSIVEYNDKITGIQSEIPENYWKIIIADIWLIVCIIKLIGVVYSYRIFVDAVGCEEIEDERIVKILERCKKELKIKKDIKLIKQDMIKMPAVIGIIDIKILFTDLVYDLSDDALTSVIMHELSHYKRKDNLINIFGMVMKSLHWFNPMIKIYFNVIKAEMEAATDEMAVTTIGLSKYTTYCKVMLEVAGKYTLREEKALGLASGKKEVEGRVNLIFHIKDMHKFSVPIIILTAIIIMFICMLLYPTSYGVINAPDVYLKSEDGTIVELTNIDESKGFTCNTIKLDKDSKVKLLIETGKPEQYIYYSKINPDNMEIYDKNPKFFSNQSIYFDVGENFYKFVVEYGNNKKANYIVKVVVE